MTMRYRLGVVATHPIQYQTPWYRAMAAHSRLELDVFFGHRVTPKEQADAGFGVPFAWDTPLLEGYRYQFLQNVASNPGIERFAGIDTPGIASLIARNKYDAVIVSGWNFKAAWQTFLACWRTGTPVMVRGDSHLNTFRSKGKQVIKAVAYRCFIPRLDACLSVGKWSAEYFRNYGAAGSRIFFVPHVLDEERFSEALDRGGERRQELRQKWELDLGATVYLFAGKFVMNKRPFDFIRAVASAARTGRKVQGLMVGDGPMRKVCESLAAELDAPVRFAGFLNQSQVVDGYIACDALVLPSESETWGLVVQEAMFCGRPCIVSDKAGCAPDLISAGATGDSFPCGDLTALSDLLVSYAADPDRLARMGAAAQERAGRYSIGAAVDGVLDALAAVTAKTCGVPIGPKPERA